MNKMLMYKMNFKPVLTYTSEDLDIYTKGIEQTPSYRNEITISGES